MCTIFTIYSYLDALISDSNTISIKESKISGDLSWCLRYYILKSYEGLRPQKSDLYVCEWEKLIFI